MKYNPDLHHRHSIRLRDYDYANSGAYFVTACLNQRIPEWQRNADKIADANFEFPIFGIIENDEIVLNEYGITAYDEWAKLSERYPGIIFDVFQAMPDHIHGIIEMRNNDAAQKTAVGRIVGAYKSLVFKKCLDISKQKNCVLGKLWQRNYYEHIIRNEAEHSKITEYIHNNPVLWGKKHLHEILPFIVPNNTHNLNMQLPEP
jgi:REP element-mobilizing transposase RayT